MRLKYRKACRVCGVDNLKLVVDSGTHFFQASFIKEGKGSPVTREITLPPVRYSPENNEDACGLLQKEGFF